MAEKHSSPDWFARGAAALGIVVSILGLVLGYSNFRWQREIQEETMAERILVHLDATRFAIELGGTIITPTSKGEVGIEVVNIGLRPVFIKKVEMRIHDRIFTLYEHAPIPPLSSDKTNPMNPLGPSEAIRYKQGWDFETEMDSEILHSQIGDGLYTWLKLPDSEIKDIEVQVQTTKKTFVFQHEQIVNVILLAKHEDRRRPSKQSPDH